MVRFVTTAYTHMYENDYIGRPEDRAKPKDPNELSPIGHKVEKWREASGLKVHEVCEGGERHHPEGQEARTQGLLRVRPRAASAHRHPDAIDSAGPRHIGSRRDSLLPRAGTRGRPSQAGR